MDWILHIFDPATLQAIVTDFQREAHQPAFWVAVGQIIWINVLLSGDNALVIALACRGLQPRQRLWGMILGAGAAVVLRIIFTGIIATLMELPYLKLIGGLALLVIAAKLLVPDEEDDEDGVKAAAHLMAAVQIVVVADIVMSLDNVIAVAAAANGSAVLLILGLAISIPLIVAGATLIMALLARYPALVWAGAALLGWVAGNVIATDPGVHPALTQMLGGSIALRIDLTSLAQPHHLEFSSELAEIVCGLLGVVIVLIAGSVWRRRKLEKIALREAAEGTPATVE